jgi:hypothetical protein
MCTKELRFEVILLLSISYRPKQMFVLHCGASGIEGLNFIFCFATAGFSCILRLYFALDLGVIQLKSLGVGITTLYCDVDTRYSPFLNALHVTSHLLTPAPHNCRYSPCIINSFLVQL